MADKTPSLVGQIPYQFVVQILALLITIIGDVSLSGAKTWAEARANAEELRQEGHEGEPGA